MSSSTSSTSHPDPLYRSIRSQMLFKIDVPKTLANFTGKHRCFPLKFAKFLKTTFFTEHLRWLLLSMLIFKNVSTFTSPFTLALLPYSPVPNNSPPLPPAY